MSTMTDPNLDEKAAKKAAKAAEKEAAKQAKAAEKADGKQGGKKDSPTLAKPSSKPSINLIPRYVTERRAAERTTRQVMYSGLAVLLILVLAIAYFWSQALAAEKAKSDAEFEQAAVQREVDALKPIADYYDGLVSRQALAMETMKGDMDYSKLLDGLYTAAGSNATIQSVDLSRTPPCAGPNPFSIDPALGCVTLTAKSPDVSAASAFLNNLNSNEDLFSSAFSADFGGSESEDGTYTVTVNYSPEALSLRFVPEDQREQAKADAMATMTAPIDPATGLPATPTTPAPATGATP